MKSEQLSGRKISPKQKRKYKKISTRNTRNKNKLMCMQLKFKNYKRAYGISHKGYAGYS